MQHRYVLRTGDVQAVYLAQRCFAVEDDGYDGVEQVGNPHGHEGRGEAGYGEGLRDGHEQDVAETKHESDADVEAHAAFGFAYGQGHAYYGEDEGGCCDGEAPFAFDFERLYVCHSALFLPFDVSVQFGRGHFFVVFFRYEEVARLEGYDGVELSSAAYVLAVVPEVAHYIVVHFPVVQGVPAYALRGKARCEPLVLVEALEREAVAGLAYVVVSADVCYLSGCDH